MKILLKSVRITGKESEFYNTVKNTLISSGAVTHISNQLGEVQVDKAIADAYVPRGWTGSSVHSGEPGYEGGKTSANDMLTVERSGFTHLLTSPLTHPVTDNKAAVIYIKDKMRCCVATVYPIGALTVESKGGYLAELYDMQGAGAVTFGDYGKPISDSDLLKVALQCIQPLDGTVISFPNGTKMMDEGVVNERIEGTRLGLKDIPALAEELCVTRDSSILEYAGERLHIPTISTAKLIALVAEAEARGLDITCSIAMHHLHFIDEVFNNSDANYRVLPPLRDAENMFAPWEALDNGVTDFMTSDHNSLDTEPKSKESDLADFGTVGLENVWGISSQYTTIEKTVTLLTAARKRFGTTVAPMAVSTVADLTLFTPEGISVLTKEDVLSASKDSAFIGTTVKGKVSGVIADNQLILNEW